MDGSTDTIRHSSYALRRLFVLGLVGLGNLVMTPTAAAHDGAAYAGTPHWVFLGITLLGVGFIGVNIWLGRTRWTDVSRRTIKSLLAGGVIAMVGAIAVIQIQIEPIGTTPTALEWYPLLAVIIGGGILIASLLAGLLRWPTRPRYTILGILLGLWVQYPAVMPDAGYTHPLGYLLVRTIPLVVGYIFWRDVSPALSTTVIDAFSRHVGAVVAALFTVFFLFSAGLFTVIPMRA